MRKGIPLLLFVVLFSASSYAEEKMICYVPKKTTPKPIVPPKPLKKEPQDKAVNNENNNSSSDIYSQATQVVINYPSNLCDNKNTFDFGRDGNDGTDGRDGIDGRDGHKGTDGADGRDGTNGHDGHKGADGTNGRDVIDGRDGHKSDDGRGGKDQYGENYKNGTAYVDYYYWLKYLLDFAVKILSIVIWPFILVKFIRVFSQEIKDIIPRIKELNLAGLKVKLHEIVDKYEDVEKNLTPEQEYNTINNPMYAVSLEWNYLEHLIYQIYKYKYKNGKDDFFNGPMYSLLLELKSGGILSVSEFNILEDLRRVRNKIVHEPSLKLSKEQGAIYLSLANNIKARLIDILNYED